MGSVSIAGKAGAVQIKVESAGADWIVNTAGTAGTGSTANTAGTVKALLTLLAQHCWHCWGVLCIANIAGTDEIRFNKIRLGWMRRD